MTDEEIERLIEERISLSKKLEGIDAALLFAGIKITPNPHGVSWAKNIVEKQMATSLGAKSGYIQ